MAEVIRLWHVTTDARVQSQSSQCEILGVNKVAVGQVFIPALWFYPLPTASFHQTSVLTCPFPALYNLTNLERRTKTRLKMPYFFMSACDRIQFR